LTRTPLPFINLVMNETAAMPIPDRACLEKAPEGTVPFFAGFTLQRIVVFTS